MVTVTTKMALPVLGLTVVTLAPQALGCTTVTRASYPGWWGCYGRRHCSAGRGPATGRSTLGGCLATG